MGPQPCCVPALLLLQACKGANAVCTADCSMTALMLVSPLYRLGSRALRGWSNASKSTWQGVSTAKSKTQEPAVSTVSLLHSHGYTLLKLVNSLVVSAGTWKHKWRWKSISWKVETNFSGLTTEPVCVMGDLLPLQRCHYWLMVCYRSQLSFIVRKIPICLMCLLVADSVRIAH